MRPRRLTTWQSGWRYLRAPMLLTTFIALARASWILLGSKSERQSIPKRRETATASRISDEIGPAPAADSVENREAGRRRDRLRIPWQASRKPQRLTGRQVHVVFFLETTSLHGGGVIGQPGIVVFDAAVFQILAGQVDFLFAAGQDVVPNNAVQLAVAEVVGVSQHDPLGIKPLDRACQQAADLRVAERLG